MSPNRQNTSGRMTRIERDGGTPWKTELHNMKAMKIPQKTTSHAPGRTVRYFHPMARIAMEEPMQEPRKSSWSMPAPPAPSRATEFR